jgi:hypothetical protein
MRTMRIGLAAGAMLLAVAAIGTGPATAASTTLCMVNTSPAACGTNFYHANTLFVGTGWADFSGATSYTGGGIKFENTAASGTPLPTKITSLTFTGCSPCTTVTAKNVSLWTMPIEVSGTGPDGKAEMLDSGGSPEFEIVCSGNLCVYTGPVLETVLGGVKGGLKGGGTLKLKSGSGCASPVGLAMLHEVPGVGTAGFYVTE